MEGHASCDILLSDKSHFVLYDFFSYHDCHKLQVYPAVFGHLDTTVFKTLVALPNMVSILFSHS